MFSTKALTLIVAVMATSFSSRVLAADVYSTFYNSGGALSPNFDIANDGCFAVGGGADSVSFSQADGSSFDGPYCLSSWADGACPGDARATQEFSSLTSGTIYGLNTGIRFAGSYKWAAAAC